MPIPREFVDYAHEVFSKLWMNKLWRFVKTDEPARWVEYEGFNFAVSNRRKLSMSITPMFCKSFLTTTKSFIAIPYDAVPAKAPPYTCGDTDPVSFDVIVPYELEVAVYYTDTTKVPVTSISTFRLMLKEEYPKTMHALHTSLSVFLHGRNYYRYVHTFYSESLVAKTMALLTLFAVQSTEFQFGLAYVVDKFYEYIGIPTTRTPCYTQAEARFEVAKHAYNRDNVDYVMAFYLPRYYYVPEEFADRIKPRVREEIEYIEDVLGLKPGSVGGVGVEHYALHYYPEAHALHRAYPDLFPTPLDAVKYIRWSYIVSDVSLAIERRARRELVEGHTITGFKDPIAVLEY